LPILESTCHHFDNPFIIYIFLHFSYFLSEDWLKSRQRYISPWSHNGCISTATPLHPRLRRWCSPCIQTLVTTCSPLRVSEGLIMTPHSSYFPLIIIIHRASRTTQWRGRHFPADYRVGGERIRLIVRARCSGIHYICRGYVFVFAFHLTCFIVFYSLQASRLRQRCSRCYSR